MKTYTFIIKGNHKDPLGNAVPKLKMTGKQSWMPRAKEYVAWKEHVVKAFFESLKGEVRLQRAAAYNLANAGKPIVIFNGELAYMKIELWWKNEAHCDPENAFGSIADALFVNDKHLDGSFVSKHGPNPEGKKQGAVFVTININ